MKSPRINVQGRGVKATSPAISTMILTGTIVVLVSVAFVFVYDYLYVSIAESDFNSAKQFMQTIGLQTDDVAWTIGRTETVRYSSRYGDVSILPSALNYTIYVNTTAWGEYRYFASKTVGILLYSVPIANYNIYNGYYEQIFPLSTSALTLTGTSAPVVRVFAVEKLSTGDYTRVVVAPSVRALFSNMTTASSSTYYVKLYLPVLMQGNSPRESQSVTVTGNSITSTTINNVTGINVTVSFPNEASGFDSSFFKFPSLYEVIDIPEGYDDAVLEFYASEVNIAFGLNP